jgi:hypothetical protein
MSPTRSKKERTLERQTDLVVIDPKIQAEIDAMDGWARSVTISNESQKEATLDMLRSIKEQRKFFDDFLDPGIRRWREGHRAAVAQKKQFTDRLDAADKAGRDAIKAFDADQARIREEERRRLQAIEDEKARKEREHLEKEAERLKSPEKKAERLQQAAAVSAPVIQIAEAPKTAGTSTPKTWKARLESLSMLTGIPEGDVRLTVLKFDQSAADALARATKSKSTIPGIEFYEDTSLRIR